MGRYVGITENLNKLNSFGFLRRNTVRSLKSARAHAKKYRDMGYEHVHIEKEGTGKYGVFTKGRRK